MLNEKGTKGSYWGWRFGSYVLIGVVVGVFSSWYIYGNAWSWPLAVIGAAFVGAAVIDKRRFKSP